MAVVRRTSGENIWLARPGRSAEQELARWSPHELSREVLTSEQAVGEAMLAELETLGRTKDGDLVVYCSAVEARKRCTGCWASALAKRGEREMP